MNKQTKKQIDFDRYDAVNLRAELEMRDDIIFDLEGKYNSLVMSYNALLEFVKTILNNPEQSIKISKLQ